MSHVAACQNLPPSTFDRKPIRSLPARKRKLFVAQRLSVAVQLSVAQEAAEALGLSVAADPRAR